MTYVRCVFGTMAISSIFDICVCFGESGSFTSFDADAAGCGAAPPDIEPGGGPVGGFGAALPVDAVDAALFMGGGRGLTEPPFVAEPPAAALPESAVLAGSFILPMVDVLIVLVCVGLRGGGFAPPVPAPVDGACGAAEGAAGDAT